MKRIYDPTEAGDGFRVLADRLWPRGVSKEKAAVDMWAKDVTPSTELRRAYHAGEMDWAQFAGQYRAELAGNPGLDEFIERVRAKSVVTLLTAAHDVEHSHLPVLAAGARDLI